MGLDFSHCAARWSYGGFHTFRIQLASEIGINLDKMYGFDGTKSAKAWHYFKDDIIPLLNHSDCNGSLTPRQCRKIAPRLRELVKNWNDEIDSYDKTNALLLADGMELAAKDGKNLEFC